MLICSLGIKANNFDLNKQGILILFIIETSPKKTNGVVKNVRKSGGKRDWHLK
jgi:hypothetical protein